MVTPVAIRMTLFAEPNSGQRVRVKWDLFMWFVVSSMYS